MNSVVFNWRSFYTRHNKLIPASCCALSLFLCTAQVPAQVKNKPIHKTTSHFLIPPPPPIIPGGNISVLSGAGSQVEFMSPAELKTQKDQLDKLIEEAGKIASDRKADLDAAKEKASQFESLYKEGVVSKKELESAASSVSPAQENADKAAGDLNQLQTQLKRVDARLATHPVRIKNNHSVKLAKKSDLAKKSNH